MSLTTLEVAWRCLDCEVGQHDKPNRKVACWNCGEPMERGHAYTLSTSAARLSHEQAMPAQHTTYASDPDGPQQRRADNVEPVRQTGSDIAASISRTMRRNRE